MDYNQLLYFVTVAEEKTILRASEKLLISQPAITRSIQNLESELGYPLFRREKKRLILNEEGEIALQEAKKVLRSFEHMQKVLDAHKRSKEKISFAGLTPAPLWGISSIAKKRMPENTFSSEVINDTGKLIEGLRDYAYQFVILDFPYNKEGFVSQPLFKEQLYIALEKNHPLAEKESVSVKDLENTVFLLLKNTGYWEELCLESMPKAEFVFQEEVSAYATILKASNLVTFRSDLTIPRFEKTEDRKYIPISDPEFTLSYYAVYADPPSRNITDLIDHVSEIAWEQYRDGDFD